MSIEISNFTPRCSKVISIATRLAKGRCDHYIGAEHLLMAMMDIGEGTAYKTLKALLVRRGNRLDDLRQQLTIELQVVCASEPPLTLPYTPQVRKILGKAPEEARKLNFGYTGTECLLLALASETRCPTSNALSFFSISYDDIKTEVIKQTTSTQQAPDQQSTPKTEKTMKDTERTLKISNLIEILELNGSGHSENLCKNLELLKQDALMDLSDLGEFSGDDGLNRLISQLSSDNRGTPTPGWFKGMVTKESIDLIVEILRRNHCNTAEEKLRQVLNLTDYKSEEETRICRILQVLTNSDTIERTIRIHR